MHKQHRLFFPASVNIYVHSIGQSFPFMICICGNHQRLIKFIWPCAGRMLIAEKSNAVFLDHTVSLSWYRCPRSKVTHDYFFWCENKSRWEYPCAPPVTPTKKRQQSSFSKYLFYFHTWNPDRLSSQQLHDLPPRIQAFDASRMTWCVPMQSVAWS